MQAAAQGEGVKGRPLPTMDGPLYRQAAGKRLRRATPAPAPEKSFATWIEENQTGVAFNLLALLLLTHFCFQKSRDYTTRFFTLSYYNERTGNYGLGSNDGYLITFFVVLFTGFRASAMDYVLSPFARWHGMTQKKAITRFSEQGWLIIYYAVVWPLGMYLYYKSPYYLNLREMWTGWPDRELDGVMKAYLLAQLSFWVQQAIVINLEERRKDHWQMYTHHIITIALIFSSYRYGLTRVGLVVLNLFDGVDIIFSSAKCLKYLGYQKICDIAFGIFMVSWILARHVGFLTVCYSVWKHTIVVMGSTCYRGAGDKIEGPFPVPKDRGIAYLLEPLYDSEGLVCFDASAQWSFLSVLLFLQGITLVWLMAIFRVAARVITGSGSDDPRSDEEDCADDDEEADADSGNDTLVDFDRHGDDEETAAAAAAAPIEEEVGVEDIDLKGWERRSGSKRERQVVATSSGVNLPGHHSDRKELLGRIGCEKQVD